MARVTVWDDGSTLTTDDYGNVIAGVDSGGQAIQVSPVSYGGTPGGSSLSDQFQRTALSALQRGLDALLPAPNMRQASSTSAPKAATFNGQTLFLLAALGVGVTLLMKAVK